MSSRAAVKPLIHRVTEPSAFPAVTASWCLIEAGAKINFYPLSLLSSRVEEGTGLGVTSNEGVRASWASVPF
jgi:hypothetical protein